MCVAVSAFPRTANVRDFHLTLLPVLPGLKKNYTFCPHYIYVFCRDLGTNSDYFRIQH